MSDKEIIVFGSVVQDLVSFVERYPKPGEAIRGKKFELFNGGKGANQAFIIAKLGGKVAMVGNVGDDIFGEANIEGLKKVGVRTDLFTKSEGIATGTGAVTVNDTGENCIVVTLGANMEMRKDRAWEIEEHIKKAFMIIAQNEIPQEANVEAFKVAKKHGVKTFLNPAPGLSDLDRSILPLTDIICVNENEAEFITQLTLKTLDEFKQAAIFIVKELGPSIAIVTLGPQGALIAEKKEDGEIELNKVDAPKVNAVDTTGAGDCFCGSLAYLLTNRPELGIVEAAKKAVHIAAISVSRPGPQASYPSLEELKDLNIL
ncbi:unnamed protein product [Bursaphelenchus xylophilus]|uniref:Ribokinase n=1 Tax=Bursaphelenchus xylophilus TaxID=6326 RepID=A0A1I7SMH3_BURXY|nr:unnamed protein product [Bursaphelenchus xylophilus]CAG9130206.1 unnamed protein product [Bursaphelenchus xylophilus]